jgi:hypothetical protein
LVRFWQIARPEVKLKVLWGFYTILTKVEDVYEVSLTADVRQVIDYFRVGLYLPRITDVLTCFGMSGYVARVQFWMYLPPVLVGMIFLGSLVLIIRKHSGCSASELFCAAMPLVLRLLFILYPQIANVAFEALSCHEPIGKDGSRFLIADVAIECRSDYYRRTVLPNAWIAIAVFCFGLLVFNGVLLSIAGRAIRQRQPTPLSKAVLFLHEEYEPYAYWWEVCDRRLNSGA